MFVTFLDLIQKQIFCKSFGVTKALQTYIAPIQHHVLKLWEISTAVKIDRLWAVQTDSIWRQFLHNLTGRDLILNSFEDSLKKAHGPFQKEAYNEAEKARLNYG